MTPLGVVQPPDLPAAVATLRPDLADYAGAGGEGWLEIPPPARRAALFYAHARPPAWDPESGSPRPKPRPAVDALALGLADAQALIAEAWPLGDALAAGRQRVAVGRAFRTVAPPPAGADDSVAAAMTLRWAKLEQLLLATALFSQVGPALAQCPPLAAADGHFSLSRMAENDACPRLATH